MSQEGLPDSWLHGAIAWLLAVVTALVAWIGRQFHVAVSKKVGRDEFQAEMRANKDAHEAIILGQQRQEERLNAIHGLMTSLWTRMFGPCVPAPPSSDDAPEELPPADKRGDD